MKIRNIRINGLEVQQKHIKHITFIWGKNMKHTVNKVFDVTIIGGGPVGLFAAFYGGLRDMKVEIIDSLPTLGGQPGNLYPEKFIYDVAGFPKISGKELTDQLVEQMNVFRPTVNAGETVEGVVKLEDGLFEITSNKCIRFAKSVLITGGVGAFQPRKLNIRQTNAEEKDWINLHYFVKQLDHFKDKQVCICGGGDSAVDWALMIEPIAKSVTIIHRRDKFRAHEHSVEKLKHSSIRILTPYNPIEINGRENRISELIVQKVKGDKKEIIPIDELIVNYGFISSLGPIQNWGLEIKKKSIVVNSRMETNIKGVYGAGDIVTYDGKVGLIATGFGEAATAISSAKVYIDPDARHQPQHSTSVYKGKVRI